MDSTQAQVEALNGTDSEINENITILTEKENVGSELLTYENKKTECENNLKTFDLQNGKCTVKASVSGYISQNMEIKQGHTFRRALQYVGYYLKLAVDIMQKSM